MRATTRGSTTAGIGPDRHRRASLGVVLTVVGALLLAAVVGTVGYRALRRYKAGTDVTVDFVRIAQTPTALLVNLTEDGSLGSLFVGVVAASGRGGHLVSLPVYVNGRVFDTTKLFPDIYAEEGRQALVDAVESTTHLTFDVVEFASPPRTAQIFGKVLPLTVTLTNNVTDPSTGETLIDRGIVDLQPAKFSAVLNNPGGRSDRVRAGNIEGVLSSLSAKVGGGLAGGVPPGRLGDFSDVFDRIVSGAVHVKILGTIYRPPNAETGEEGYDLLDIDRDILLFASISPSNMSSPSPNLIYRIEAPPGSEQRVADAIGLINFMNGNVVQVDLTATAPGASSVIELYDARNEDRLATTNPLFGKVLIERPRERIEGVDAVLRLGTEFLSAPPIERPDPASRASTPVGSASSAPGNTVGMNG